MANVEKLLHWGSAGVDLIAKLEPRPDERAQLSEAKLKIRNRLRERVEAFTKTVLGTAIPPRFFTQGSDAYKMLNRPAHMPPQQMDFDDGMYLPLSFLKEESRPSIASDRLFAVVDATLQELADEEGWTFDDSKPTCARLMISEHSHVDVPLYSIPDEEFATMRKAILAREASFADSAIYGFAQDQDVDVWEELPTEHVLLAHRDEGWKRSDPRKISNWVKDCIDLYGEQFRRMCRYLKAWRDFHKQSNVCSLLLMVCVFEVYEELGRKMPDRDDRALAKIAERLPDLLTNLIYNPTDPDEKLCARLTDEDRQAAVAKAHELAAQIGSIVDHCYNPELAIRELKHAFGPRIADRPDLVVIERAAETVYAKPREHVVAPAVGRSISG
jgi:hypothetical protein